MSINQPCYLGWMGYFDRIKKSDLHIVLDHVQFEKGSFTNRCLIRQRDGRTMWLTVPVEKGKRLADTGIVGETWRRKHDEALRQAYRLNLDWIYRATYRGLLPLLLDVTKVLASHLRIAGPSVLSSRLGGDKLGKKSELVLNLCKEVGASTYLSGPHGRDYLDLPSFERAGIEVAWHDYPVVQPVLSAVHDLFS